MRLRVKFSKKWIIVFILIVLVAGYLILDSMIRPTILSLSEARLRAIGVKSLNDAVRETFGSSNVTYSDLIHIEKDSAGKPSLITSNTVLMNNLAAQTAMAAQDKILNAGQQGVSIPIGTVIGGPLLTGRGPAIVIKFEPVGRHVFHGHGVQLDTYTHICTHTNTQQLKIAPIKKEGPMNEQNKNGRMYITGASNKKSILTKQNTQKEYSRKQTSRHTKSMSMNLCETRRGGRC
jgi:sporulation protein YunB